MHHNHIPLIKQLQKNSAFKALKTHADLEGCTLKTKPEEFCITVKEGIGILAQEEKLQDLDTQFMERFCDRFMDIPHTDQLLIEVIHILSL